MPITTPISSQNPCEELKSVAEAKLKAIKPVVGANGKEIFYFDDYVETPQGSFGMLGLYPAYRKIFAQDHGTGVGVGMGILSVTNINSMDKIVGLEIFLNLAWEDDRIVWPLAEGLQQGQEWEFDTKVLK